MNFEEFDHSVSTEAEKLLVALGRLVIVSVTLATRATSTIAGWLERYEERSRKDDKT